MALTECVAIVSGTVTAGLMELEEGLEIGRMCYAAGLALGGLRVSV